MGFIKTKKALLICTAILASMYTKAADEAKLPVLKITIDASIVRDMPYANGTMQLTDTDGKVTEMKAKFKTRGATAQKYLMKPSLNMKLRTDDYSASQDASLLDIRSASKWILDAMAIDRICMRNRICMDVWNEYSQLPYETDFNQRSGTVGKFVELYINNEHYGIYCMSDQINRKLLNLKKYDETKGLVRGVLYKSGTEDIADQNSRNFTEDYTAATISWHNAWELKEPEDYPCAEAWQPLLDLYDNIKTYDQVKQYFDLGNLVDYQLLIMAFSIQDNWGNKNHFLSVRNIQKDINDADPTEAARRKFIVSPWDLDTSLGGRYDGAYYNGTYSTWNVADVIKNGGFFPFSLCQGQAEYKELLKKRWEELRNGALSESAINKRLEDYRDLFVNSGAWKRMTDTYDAKSSKPCYVNDLAKEVSLIEGWYADKCIEMDKYFGVTTPTGIEEINTEDTEDKTCSTIYDIQGVRYSSLPNTPGVFIQNGKKIIKGGNF